MSGDVKTQCEIDSNASGIKLADAFYDGLVPAANIESTVNETTTGVYGTDGGFVTKNLVKKNGCKIEVYSPAEHTNLQVAIPYVDTSASPQNVLGSIPVFTTTQTAITTATLTNPTKRTMNYSISTYWNSSMSNSQSGVNFQTLSRFFLDPGTGTLVLKVAAFNTANVPAGAAASLDSYTAPSNESFDTYTLAAGASVTIRMQGSIESFTATTLGTQAIGVSGVIRAWTV
jgi:hypothetical protein